MLFVPLEIKDSSDPKYLKNQTKQANETVIYRFVGLFRLWNLHNAKKEVLTWIVMHCFKSNNFSHLFIPQPKFQRSEARKESDGLDILKDRILFVTPR